MFNKVSKDKLVIPDRLEEIPYKIVNEIKCLCCQKGNLYVQCRNNQRPGFKTCDDTCQNNLNKIICAIRNATGVNFTIEDITIDFKDLNKKFGNILIKLEQDKKRRLESSTNEIEKLTLSRTTNDSEIGIWITKLKKEIPDIIQKNSFDYARNLLNNVDDFIDIKANDKDITPEDTIRLNNLFIDLKDKNNKKEAENIQSERDTLSSMSEKTLKRKIERDSDEHITKKRKIDSSNSSAPKYPYDSNMKDTDSLNSEYNNNKNPCAMEIDDDSLLEDLETEIMGPENKIIGPRKKTTIPSKKLNLKKKAIHPNRKTGEIIRSLTIQGLPVFTKRNPNKNSQCKRLYWVAYCYGGHHKWLKLHDYEDGKHYGYQNKNFNTFSFFREMDDEEIESLYN